MTTPDTQLSLFGDMTVTIPPPQKPGALQASTVVIPTTTSHAITFGTQPQAAEKKAQPARHVPKEIVTRTVEPDLIAKLRVTQRVYQVLHHVADQALISINALLADHTDDEAAIDDVAALTIAKSALEAPMLHAAIQLQACMLAPLVVTETRASVPQPTPAATADAGQRAAHRHHAPASTKVSPVRPGKHLPMVPYVLVAQQQKHPYQLTAIERRATVYITPERIRVRDAHGKEINLTHQEVWCIESEPKWQEGQALYATYQQTLDALAARYRAYGNYQDQLAAHGGATLQQQPLTPTVIRIENPDRDHGWATRWGVPTINRSEVKKHTDSTLEGKNHGLGDSALYILCRSDEDAAAMTADHKAAVTAQQAWLAFLKACGTVREAATDDRYGTPWADTNQPMFAFETNDDERAEQIDTNATADSEDDQEYEDANEGEDQEQE